MATIRSHKDVFNEFQEALRQVYFCKNSFRISSEYSNKFTVQPDYISYTIRLHLYTVYT